MPASRLHVKGCAAYPYSEREPLSWAQLPQLVAAFVTDVQLRPALQHRVPGVTF